jgi:hypothetical protein
MSENDILYQGECSSQCPLGYFVENRLCKPCDLSCKKCSGNSSN